MAGTTVKTFDDIWSWADTKGTRCPTSIGVLEIAGASKNIRRFMRDACGVFDEYLPWMRERALVAELCGSKIVYVFLGPSPLDTAVFLDVVE